MPLPYQAGLHLVQVLHPSHPVHFSPLAQAGHSDVQHLPLLSAHLAHLALGLHFGHEAHPAHPVHFSPLAHPGHRAAVHVAHMAESQQESFAQQDSFAQQEEHFLQFEHPKVQAAATMMAMSAMSLVVFMGQRLPGGWGGGQLRASGGPPCGGTPPPIPAPPS